MSGNAASEAEVRIAAEALALRRAPLDPLRAVAAAECAGLEVSTTERALLGDLLERLGDRALASAALTGDPEGASRLATLVVADAIHRGATRLLWVGPRPRSVDRLCERCAVRLVAVRNERGAYDGDGLFFVDELEGAPPGLAQAAPFDRVVTSEPLADPPWTGPTLALGGDEGALRAPAVERPEPALSLHPPSPSAAAVDEALAGALCSLEPGLGPLARAAAGGSKSNRVAALKRLETRLGRMVRAVRAGRVDDGEETARQLASDRDGSGGLLAAALAADHDTSFAVDELEAERARLADLRATLEAEPDPIVDALVAHAREALEAGRGVAIVVPGRGTRDALVASLGDEVARTGAVDERLAAARRGPAIAILSLAEHRSERLDPVSLGELRVLAHRDAPIAAADTLVGEGEPCTRERTPRAPTSPDPASDRWQRWRQTVGLTVATAHPEARAAIADALRNDPTPWSIAHLSREEGEVLLVVGQARADGLAFDSTAEASFDAELALLRVARSRLERALAAARHRRQKAHDRLRTRRRTAEQRIEEARRRKARASGEDARREAAEELAEAEEALGPLRAEAESIDDAHRAERRAALDRFAARASIGSRGTDSPTSSHPRERLHG